MIRFMRLVWKHIHYYPIQFIFHKSCNKINRNRNRKTKKNNAQLMFRMALCDWTRSLG